MALILDRESHFKHFCKICNKGFLCGRALGGHMRAHGIGDVDSFISFDDDDDDDDEQASDWEDKMGGEDDVPSSKKRMYALRTNPNRFKSCRVCEKCGKEFSSWKSFLEHGKCSSQDAESLVSSPAGSDGDVGAIGPRASGWSKRKRSFRAQVGHFNSNCPSSEEDDLAANCLMMLSNAAAVNRNPTMAPEPEESCASASKEEENIIRRNPMNFISSFPCKIPTDYNKAKGVAKAGLFECKACKKVFNSHQALGGHRASHKKVKGCFASKLDHEVEDDVITREEFFPTKPNSSLGHGSNAPYALTSKRKSKVHECSICHRVFSSGQALGGHKRCHWITSNAPDKSTLARFQQFQEKLEHLSQIPATKFDSDSLDLNLDLNLPAPGNHQVAGDRRRNVTTEIYLQSWRERKEADHEDENNEDRTNKKKPKTWVQNNVDDEADSTVKLAKLSELKDMNFGGSSTAWLQVGISSRGDLGTET